MNGNKFSFLTFYDALYDILGRSIFDANLIDRNMFSIPFYGTQEVVSVKSWQVTIVL